MRVWLGRDGLYVHINRATATSRAVGFVIKPAKHMLFSERHTNRWRGALRLGPLYFRTYAHRGEE